MLFLSFLHPPTESDSISSAQPALYRLLNNTVVKKKGDSSESPFVYQLLFSSLWQLTAIEANSIGALHAFEPPQVDIATVIVLAIAQCSTAILGTIHVLI